MSSIDWEKLSKDLEKILEQKETLDIKFSINELTWASGDSRYEISYDITSKNNFQSLTEDYYLDKNDDEDGYSIASSHLISLKDKFLDKGYYAEFKEDVLKIKHSI